MARAFDPKRLFGRYRDVDLPGRHPYTTVRDELAGARSGKKPMSMHRFGALDLVDERFMTYLQLAAEHEVVVTLWQPRSERKLRAERRDAIALATRREELWRVPAFMSLREASETDALSSFAEDHQSALLGYTRTQRRTWHAYLQAARAEHFLYMLLDRDRRADVLAHGKRCLGDAGDCALFAHARASLKPDAIDLVPRGFTLARFDVDVNTRLALFRDWRTNPDLISRQLTAKQLARLNAGLQRPIELLTRRGWR